MIPGAHLDGQGTQFVVFSDRARDVRVRVVGGDRVDEHPLEDRGDGFYAAHVPGVAAGALAQDEDDDYGLLFIPIFGPSLFDRRRGEGPALTMFGTVPELTGALLMLLGATGTRRFAAQSEPTISVAPLMTPHASGLSVYGAF